MPADLHVVHDDERPVMGRFGPERPMPANFRDMVARERAKARAENAAAAPAERPKDPARERAAADRKARGHRAPRLNPAPPLRTPPLPDGHRDFTEPDHEPPVPHLPEALTPDDLAPAPLYADDADDPGPDDFEAPPDEGDLR